MDEAAVNRHKRLDLLKRKRTQLEQGESSSRSRKGTDKCVEPLDVGLPDNQCQHCGAFFWYRERCKRSSTIDNPKYNLCCREGRIALPVVRDPPNLLDINEDNMDSS